MQFVDEDDDNDEGDEMEMSEEIPEDEGQHQSNMFQQQIADH